MPPSDRKKGCACGGTTVKRSVNPRIPGSSQKYSKVNKGSERLFGIVPGSRIETKRRSI